MPPAKIDGLIALIDGIYSRNDALPRVACLAPNAPGGDIAARFVAAMQNREPQIAAVHVSDLDAALGFLGNPEDAREASQEAFVRAFKALSTYDPSRPFYP